MTTSKSLSKDIIATIIRDEAGKLTPQEKQYAQTAVAPHIQPKAAERAVANYGAGAKAEDVLFMANTAAMKFGAKGVFLTDSAIYRSPEVGEGPAHIDYASIGVVDFSTSEVRPVLYVNKEPFCVGPDKVATKLIADILVAIQRALSADVSGVLIKARLETVETLKTEELITESEYQEIRSGLLAALKQI